MAEPKTGLEFWPPGAMQPDLLFNALLYWLAAWGQAVVLAIEDDPPGSPDEGDSYLVATGTGAWTGHDDSMAYWDGDAWLFFAPLDGYVVRNLATSKMLVYGGSWTVWSGGGGSGAQCIPIACSDETTDLTTGTAKVTFRMPYAFTLSEVRASLTVAQPSGSIFTVDINEGGTTILSTKLTIDNNEKTSTTAATAPVISDSSLADDAEITIDIDQVGAAGAKGLKVYLIGTPT